MIPTITLKSGNVIPRLGLGTYMIGGGMKIDPNNDDDGQIESIRYSIDKGISWIRTAQNYAEGHCEEVIGKAIKDSDRNKLCIMIAVNQRFAKNENEFIKEATGSLKRLGIEYADLYLIGGLEESVSLKTVANGLKKIKNLGLAKDIGVGNYRLEELKQIHEYLGDELVYNEMHANLIIREPFINGVYDYCLANKIVMGAYRPLQLGQLSRPGIIILDMLAKKYNKTQAEISLKWLLSYPNIITMPKMSNSIHVDQVVSIFDWDLDEGDVKLLTTEFPVQIGISDCTPPKSTFRK